MARLRGYKEQVGSVDPSLIEEGDFTWDSGAEATRRLLERAPDIDAIFAANDLMAAGAIAVLNEQGRRVPEDVAVVGFDDSSVALATTPQLTTLRQPFDRVSREVVRLLLEVIDGLAPAAMSLPLELVVRGSA
ncbi:LacI family DNA-binding transcriptional regulator [Tessaracoccus coleopterorum]|uniref:LacI family DNA-binding transcriptional regulator n=1 Tax=Tessaracoccus coleopterorum TaxID=2714950 RepID=UPI001E2F40A0|nr:substrate-binding domain-containing protein [Tessaracoccus coleopterorum]